LLRGGASPLLPRIGARRVYVVLSMTFDIYLDFDQILLAGGASKEL